MISCDLNELNNSSTSFYKELLKILSSFCYLQDFGLLDLDECSPKNYAKLA